MSGSFRDGELDPTPRSPQIPTWPDCNCHGVGKGDCVCYEDDGTITHGGVHREGFDHGEYRGGDYVRCANRRLIE